MQPQLKVVVDEKAVMFYDKNTRHPARLRRFFDEMDQDMEQGISLGSEEIASPKMSDKITYVAIQLVRAVDAHNNNMIEITAGWLVQRAPELDEVKVTLENDNFSMQLVYA